MRPGTGISSIDENSVFSDFNQRSNNSYGKSSYENNSIRPTLQPEFHPGQTANPSSLNYVNANATPNYSPPYSDLNPISLPYLGTSLTTRPVSTIYIIHVRT